MTRYIIFVFIVLFQTSCTKVWHKANQTYTPHNVSRQASVKPDQEIANFIQPYTDKLQAEMDQLIGTSAVDMYKGKPECLLGNWMADAILKAANNLTDYEVDFAVQNYGGIRIPVVKKGDITRGKIFELMPFENALVILEVKGTVLNQFIEHLVFEEGWPISSELKIISENNNITATLKGKDIEENNTYFIAVPDYIANGGNDCSFFIDQKREVFPNLIRDLLIADVIDRKVINPSKEGRFIIR